MLTLELKTQLEAVIKPYLNQRTEGLDCDGMSRVVATLLTRHFPQVEFVPMCGHLTDQATGQVISWHVWLDLGEGWLIDYKARRWLRDRTKEKEVETAQAEVEAQRIPHGVFNIADHADFLYEGEDWRDFTNLILLPQALFAELTQEPDEATQAMIEQIYRANLARSQERKAEANEE